MLELKMEHDYVVVDSKEWIEDRTDGVNEEVTEAFDAWCEANPSDGYGYDTDSRKDYDTWKQCVSIGKRLQRFLADDYGRFRYLEH